MKKKNKKSFEIRARRCLLLTLGLYIMGGLAVKSIESSNNIDQQKIEDEIVALKSDIDGLDIERQAMTSFARLNSVANSQGYEYTHNDVTAYVTSE